MEITEIRIHLRNEDKLKAFATVTFDHVFVVRNLKVIGSKDGLMLAMPSRRMPDGSFKDVAHPINAEFRSRLEAQVFACYEKEARKNASRAGTGSQVV